MADSESAALAALEAKLMDQFGDAVGTAEVTRCLRDAIAHYEGVVLRSYVVLMIERRATNALREIKD
jgi:hypothetical protein